MFKTGQLVTVTDGGWTGAIRRIDTDLNAAYIQFPNRPDLPCYAFEAIAATQLTEMTTTELQALLLTVRLTAAEMRAIRAEIKSREI